MKTYTVMLIVHYESNQTETVKLSIEAGNKKTAYMRAMTDIRNNPKYKDVFISLDKIIETNRGVM